MQSETGRIRTAKAQVRVRAAGRLCRVRTVCLHVSGRRFQAEPVRPLRHAWQRLAMGAGLYHDSYNARRAMDHRSFLENAVGGWSAAVPGSAFPGTCARPSASVRPHRSGTTISVSGWPERYFLDLYIFTSLISSFLSFREGSRGVAPGRIFFRAGEQNENICCSASGTLPSRSQPRHCERERSNPEVATTWLSERAALYALWIASLRSR